MSVPLDLVAWLVQERYIISLFHAARALHAWLVQEYVKIGCLPNGDAHNHFYCNSLIKINTSFSSCWFIIFYVSNSSPSLSLYSFWMCDRTRELAFVTVTLNDNSFALFTVRPLCLTSAPLLYLSKFEIKNNSQR